MRHRLARFTLLSLLLAVFAMALAPLSSASAQVSTSSVTAPVTGTVAGGGTFSGVYTITSFANQAGNLVANGTLTGTLTDALGNVIGTVTNVPVTIPVTSASGTCQILHLTLGPLDLNLLGLMVHLNQVVLDITAQSGPGNLLGNLLCGVAHLLDQGLPLGSLSNLLNQILHSLG